MLPVYLGQNIDMVHNIKSFWWLTELTFISKFTTSLSLKTIQTPQTNKSSIFFVQSIYRRIGKITYDL